MQSKHELTAFHSLPRRFGGVSFRVEPNGSTKAQSVRYSLLQNVECRDQTGFVSRYQKTYCHLPEGNSQRMRVIIFSNGDPGDLRRAGMIVRDGDLILAADGGAVHAVNAGILPDVVIGDLDSLENHPETLTMLRDKGVAFRQYPVEKDYTDLELAMDYALEQKASSICIMCPFGARLDHLLGNILLATLSKYERIPISFYDGLQKAFILRSGEEREIRGGSVGAVLSLVPLTPRVSGVFLSGTRWPLTNQTLNFGSTWTLSNSIAESIVTVSVGSGCLLAVFPNTGDMDIS